MLIVDYAESRQDDVVWLADQLLRRAESTTKPARLVLLSRGSGVWWRELVQKSQSLQDLCSLGGEAYDEIEIPEKIAVQDRRALFDASVKAFRPHGSAIPGYTAESRPPSPDLFRALDTEDDYQRPLAVQIAALLHVAGVDQGRSGIAGLLHKILGLEYEYWDKALKIGGQSNWLAAVKNGVAQVTLVGAVESAQRAAELVGRDPLFGNASDIDVPRVCHKLSLIFPGENDGLAGLEPDLIGEHHVLEVVTSDALVDACLGWAGEDRERRQHILRVLNRATRPEHGENARYAEGHLARLIQTHAAGLGGDLIRVAVEAPGRLLDLCRALEAQVESLDEPALAAIDAALPLQSQTLMDLSLRVAERLTHLARAQSAAVDAPLDASKEESATIQGHLAGRVETLGIRLSNLGRHEEALAALQETVDIRRRLAQMRLDAFLPDLAMSLNNLGTMLSDLGRREEALAASQEAVDIRRPLAQMRPDAFLSDLAGSLNNLGGDLSDLGRREEALAASQEAVDITRRLAQTRPDAFLPNLAMSLDNLGNRLSNLGRREEALAASQEAVDITRRLAQTRPEAFLPDLARSLNHLGIRLSNLGRREEALAAMQETVDITRRLAQTRPDAFLPDLAGSLDNLGIRLSNLGRGEEALAATQEAVDIYRRLAQTRPDAFLPDLASGLNNLGIRLSNLGRGEEALAATQEAVDIYQRLAQTRPDAFLPDLARSLGAFSAALAATERHGDAAAAAREGLMTIAPFVETHPQVFRDLTRALWQSYLSACEQCGTGPDQALLARVANAV